jgi:hypothetical protein
LRQWSSHLPVNLAYRAREAWGLGTQFYSDFAIFQVFEATKYALMIGGVALLVVLLMLFIPAIRQRNRSALLLTVLRMVATACATPLAAWASFRAGREAAFDAIACDLAVADAHALHDAAEHLPRRDRGAWWEVADRLAELSAQGPGGP